MKHLIEKYIFIMLKVEIKIMIIINCFDFKSWINIICILNKLKNELSFCYNNNNLKKIYAEF